MMKFNLFCVHYAGGSRYSYNMYTEHAPEFINIIPVELPGRGTRVKEALLTDIEAMAADIFRQIKDRLQQPYAIYGHSLGAILCYLVTIKIVENKLNQPVHLFVSGRGGPSVVRNGPFTSELPREAFIDKVKELGGLPNELLQDDYIMNFFEPILRSDFKGVEQYKYKGPFMLNIPVTVMIGQDEKVSYADALEWRKETSKEVAVKVFPGKHFFIFNYPREIVHIIADVLKGSQM